MKRLPFFLFGLIVLCAACHHEPGTPKPRAYPRIEYPERKYVEYSATECPFQFEYPSYAEIKNKKESCWFDLFIPAFDARIHCSYVAIENRAKYDDLVGDAYNIADKINERANYMSDTPVRNGHGVSGVVMEWKGPAASPMHFFLTDTTQHFFTAALYFDSKVNPDSLAPIARFIRQDINHMIETFDWKN